MNIKSTQNKTLIVQAFGKCDHLRATIEDTKKQLERCPTNIEAIEYLEEVNRDLKILLTKF